MKVCPVCKTALFEDMEVCYGCMYHFGSNPELEKRMKDEAVKIQGDAQQGAIERSEVRDLKQEKGSGHTELTTQKKLMERQEAKGDLVENEQLWIVRFEVRRSSDENQVWAAEATLPLKAIRQTPLSLA